MMRQFFGAVLYTTAVWGCIASSVAQGQTKAAQDVQVETNLLVSYQVAGGTTYTFDWNGLPSAVAVYDTYFTYTKTGNPNPSQIASAKHEAVRLNKCKFFCGEALVSVTTGFGSNGTVTSVPKAPGQYPAKTGWTSHGDSTTASLDLNLDDAFVASRSVITRALGPKTNKFDTKYSFSLRHTDGTSRLTALTVQLYKGDNPIGSALKLDAELSQTLEDVDTNGEKTWWYQRTAGPFGNSAIFGALLYVTGYVNDIVNGTISEDNFKGNDNKGGTRARIQGIALTVNAPQNGEQYSVKFIGTIKGNDFVSEETFTIITVVADGTSPCSCE